MRLVSGKTTLWVAITLLSAAMALGQGAGARRGRRWSATGRVRGSASAAGATILRRACGSCHGADVIANHHYESADGYRDVVNSMIDVGAQVTPQELPVLVDYLFATYGKKPADGAAATAQQQPIRERRFSKRRARPVMDSILGQPRVRHARTVRKS